MTEIKLELTLDKYVNTYNQIRFDEIEKLINEPYELLSYLGVSATINNIEDLKNDMENLIHTSLYDEDGEDIAQLQQIKEELEFRNLIENEDNLQQRSILQYIFDCFRSYITKYNNQKVNPLLLYKIKSFDSPAWHNILELAYIIIKKYPIYTNNQISEVTRNVALAIKELKEYKFEITYKSSKFIQLPDKEIVKEIENLISCLGGLDVTEICVRQLNKSYNEKLDYIIIPQITNTMPSKRPARICWLYLLNLSLKHLNDVPKQLTPIMQDILWEKLQNIVRAYIACYNLEIYYSLIFIEPDNYLDFISRTALFNFVFNPRQLSFEQFNCFIDELFRWVIIENSDVYAKIQEAKELANFIINKKTNGIVIFNKNELSFLENIDEYIIDADKINKDYKDPNDSTFQFSKSIYCRPFIRLKNKSLLFLNQNIVLYALFENIYSIVREKLNNKEDSLYVSKKLGHESEELIFNKLETLSHTDENFILKNAEYKISKDIRKELNVKKELGEIDCLIGTKDCLLIMQIKNKPITTNASLGNNVNILSDLSMSMVNALEQLTWDDFIIHKNGYFELTNGTRIYKNNRRIIKCIVSLFDYQGLQEPQLVSASCRFFAHNIHFNLKTEEMYKDRFANVISKFEKDFSNLNESIENISAIFSKLVEINKNKEREIDTIFLNIPFLITVINRESSLNDFVKMIVNFMHTNYGTHNLYATYREFLRLFHK